MSGNGSFYNDEGIPKEEPEQEQEEDLVSSVLSRVAVVVRSCSW
jgi:hypothetical protein